jgi:hypothetical protein
MQRALILVLFCGVTVSLALAQPPAPTGVPAAPPPSKTAASGRVDITRPGRSATPGRLGKTRSVVANHEEARELPLDSETFDVRVHRRVTEYSQRHQQRERRISSYDKVSVRDPGLERFADPSKVQVELSDELDRERTSEELAADYAEQAHAVQIKAQALQEFIAKRGEKLDGLNKHDGVLSRPGREMTRANLARQPLSPETLAARREIDRRLWETERNEKDLPVQGSWNQQETADAAEDLTKLQALQQAYEKEAKAFTADALSARQNRLRLANKLEYSLVRAQAAAAKEQAHTANADHPGYSNSPDPEAQRVRDEFARLCEDTGARRAFYDDLRGAVERVRAGMRDENSAEEKLVSFQPAARPSRQTYVEPVNPPLWREFNQPQEPPPAKPPAPQLSLGPYGDRMDHVARQRVVRWAKANGAPVSLALGVAWMESHLNTNPPRGAAGEVGMFQIMPERCRLEGWSPKRLSEPEFNAWMGTMLLARYYQEEGSVARAAAKYVAGPGVFNKGYSKDMWAYINWYATTVDTYASYFSRYQS